MSRPSWLSVTAEHSAKILHFPVTPDTAPPPGLGGALTHGSPENLIFEASNVLTRVLRLAHSLTEDQRLTVLGDLLTLQTQRLEPLQMWVERHRAFLSELSVKTAKKNRRRRKRVKQQIERIA